MDAKPAADGYVAIQRTWNSADTIDLNFKLEPRVIVGDHSNEGKIAICYGPLVLAADGALLPSDVKNVALFVVASPDLAGLAVTPKSAPDNLRSWPGAQVFHIKALARRTGAALDIGLIPFADAGSTGLRYKVWLPLAGQPGDNISLNGVESRSRPGDKNGSINDEDIKNWVSTFDGQLAKEDWFAVTLDAPVTIRQVVFVPGESSHHGGWFDTSVSKPRVQVQRNKDDVWETVGELGDYPVTTATNGVSRQLIWQGFTCRLTEPTKAIAVRVIGTPACGDDPTQSFSTCSELRVFGQ